MIGVLAKTVDRQIVAEFFELFKTPWEFYRTNGEYDVVISTNGDIPKVPVRLLIQYSSNLLQSDSEHSINIAVTHHMTMLQDASRRFPIYGKVAVFEDSGEELVTAARDLGVVALRIGTTDGQVIRAGFDLFDEVTYLLSKGQPAEYAPIPTLDVHIAMLRKWILEAGIPVVEIPPVPMDYNFIACLTHDVDFAGIRHHKFDHTMWGFVYRALLCSLADTLRGKLTIAKMLKNWQAVISLPLVYFGLRKDFWLEFEKYQEIEGQFRSTFFLIPFKNRMGTHVSAPNAGRRATRYDIDDISEVARKLNKEGWEIGLHGIDAWHSAKSAQTEVNRIAEVIGQKEIGNRIHWLCFNGESPGMLESAGISYDSTLGYNNAVGFRNGTTQVFRLLGAKSLPELPLHLQDVALLGRGAMNLSDEQAWQVCTTLFDHVFTFGGVVTILWHTRSLAPERLWDDFYIKLLEEIKIRNGWVGTASKVVNWFGMRRNFVFEKLSWKNEVLTIDITGQVDVAIPFLRIRVYLPRQFDSARPEGPMRYTDVPWSGEQQIEIDLKDISALRRVVPTHNTSYLSDSF